MSSEREMSVVQRFWVVLRDLQSLRRTPPPHTLTQRPRPAPTPRPRTHMFVIFAVLIAPS